MAVELADHGGGDSVVAEDLGPANRRCHMFPVADLAFDLLLRGSGAAD